MALSFWMQLYQPELGWKFRKGTYLYRIHALWQIALIHHKVKNRINKMRDGIRNKQSIRQPVVIDVLQDVMQASQPKTSCLVPCATRRDNDRSSHPSDSFVRETYGNASVGMPGEDLSSMANLEFVLLFAASND